MRCLWAVVVVVCCGCMPGEPPPFRKVTIPVTGQVLVDGKTPATPVRVSCPCTDGVDVQHPTVSQCFTEPDGRFQFSTYVDNDGVPPGNYSLTFYWGEMNTMSMSFGGPDKLKDRYSDPKASMTTFSVKEGMPPIDLGKIDLATR